MELKSNKNIHTNILTTIGDTPIVQLQRCVPKSQHQFFAKLEFVNPGSSVKDRIALAFIEAAEKSGDSIFELHFKEPRLIHHIK